MAPSLFAAISLGYVCVWLLVVTSIFAQDFTTADPQKFVTWGPGLDGRNVMPIRYIFVQTVDANGNNITSDIENEFSVEIIPEKGTSMRARMETLSHHNGQFVVRITLYSVIKYMEVKIMWQDADIRGSPFRIGGPMHYEECNCPVEKFDGWQSHMGCREGDVNSIKESVAKFKPLSQSEFESTLDAVRLASGNSFGYYIIKNNTAYRKDVGYGMRELHETWDFLIVSLTRKVSFPDMIIVVNYMENPAVGLAATLQLPVVGWSTTSDHSDLIGPNKELITNAIDVLSYHTSDTVALVHYAEPVWSKKVGKIYWRGEDTSDVRVNLVRMSSTNPGVVDAKFTSLFNHPNDSTLGTLSISNPLKRAFTYKFVAAVDGAASDFLLPIYLSGKTVVLKQESQFREYFYDDLQPNVHFIPVRSDLSDLAQKVTWLRSNDAVAEEIAVNAQKFALDHFQPRDVICYYMTLFMELSTLQKGPIELTPEHKPVPRFEYEDCDCLPVSTSDKHEEL